MVQIINLDDTDNCPLGNVCEICGCNSDLETSTVQSPLGVFCLTLCDDCWNHGSMPRVSLPEASRRCLYHCAHLGVDADDMALAIEARSHG